MKLIPSHVLPMMLRAHLLAIEGIPSLKRRAVALPVQTTVGDELAIVMLCARSLRCKVCESFARGHDHLELGMLHPQMRSGVEVDDVTVTEPTAPAAADGLPP